MTWTLRPPHPEEPACWSWPVPPAEDYDTVRARLIAENAGKQGDERLDVGTIEMMLGAGHEWVRFNDFHDGRCACCGRRPFDGHLVEDHCHETGQARGELCRSCNIREGRSDHALFIRYRRIHPASILDFHEMYTGVAWTDGWSWHTDGAEANKARRGRNVRPASPWVPWSPDTPLDAGPPAGWENVETEDAISAEQWAIAGIGLLGVDPPSRPEPPAVPLPRQSDDQPVEVGRE